MIDYEIRAAVYAEARRQYGAVAQVRMCIEELAELIQAVCKLLRRWDSAEGTSPLISAAAHVSEEAADVLIMLEQLRIILPISDAVDEWMDSKVRRLANRLGMDLREGADDGTEV